MLFSRHTRNNRRSPWVTIFASIAVISPMAIALYLNMPRAIAAPTAPSAPAFLPATDLHVPAGEKVVEVTPNTYGNRYSGDVPSALVRVRTRPMLPAEQPETYTVHTFDGTGPAPVVSWKVVESR